MERTELDKLSRDELIERARGLGIDRPEVMTRVELGDEIVRRLVTDESARRRARGWLGVARDLVASLIEQGLHMPDAAELVRKSGLSPMEIRHQPPVATVTLAEIYAAQGHLHRAIKMLDEVVDKEPDHEVARRLRERLDKQRSADAGRPARRSRLAHSEPPARQVASLVVPAAEVEAKAPPEPEPAEPAPAAPVVEAAHAPTEPQPAAPARSDAIVVIRSAADEVDIVWELGDASAARHAGSEPSIRLIVVTPGARAPSRNQRVLAARGRHGIVSQFVPPDSKLRAALGFERNGTFSAVAVSVELAREAGEPRLMSTPLSLRILPDLAMQQRALLESSQRR